MACPIRCPGEEELVGIAPAMGADNQEILAGLGYDDSRIAALMKSKVI